MNLEDTIADIRRVLGSDGVVAEERVVELAREFDGHCDQVNERLRKCAGLLRKGLRSEAVHLAEISPNLLEAATLLDFPERDAWAQLLQDVGMPSPARLDLESAAALNEAYAVDEGMRKLLARHRRMALARAPLIERLSVLQAIADSDPDNAVWLDDIRRWEHACFQQMADVGNAALKRGDRSALVELVNQLRNTPWREPPPPALVNSLVTAEDKLSRRWARNQLVHLEPAVNAAYGELDVDEARRLRAQWLEYNSLAQLEESDDLAERVAPAFEWLEEEDRRAQEAAAHAAAIANLEQALDQELTRTELERRYHALERFDADVPDLLRNQYRARIDSLELIARRRRYLVVGAALIVVVFAAYGAWSWISSSQFAEAVAKNTATLQQLLEEEKLPEARDFVDRLVESDPKVAQSPEVSELVARLEAEEKIEADRRERFDLATISAENAISQSVRNKAIDEARRLAATDAERGRVARLERAVEEARAEKQQQIDAGFREQVALFDARLGQLTALDESDPKYASTASELLADLKAFLQQSGAVSSQSRASARAIETRLTGLVGEIARREAEAEALQELLGATSTPQRYAAALVEFAKDYPDTSRALDMKAVATEVELWNELLAWSDLVKQWDSRPRMDLSPVSAKEWSESFDALLSKPGKSPYRKNAEGKLRSLREIAARTQLANGDEIGRFRSQFRSELFRNVSLVTKANGERNYISLPIDEATAASKQKVTLVEVFQDIAGKTRPDVLPDGRLEEAPQSVIAPRLEVLLGSGLADAWDERFFEMIQIIDGQENLDAVLKMSLLKDTLYLAEKGNSTFADAFREWKREFDSPDIDLTVQWVSPTDPIAKSVRESCQRVLASRVPFDQVQQDFSQANHKELEAFSDEDAQLAPYAWQGILVRHSSGQWECQLTQQPSGPLILCVLSTNSLGTAEIVDIGTATADGQVELTTARNSYFREGRPVFARSE